MRARYDELVYGTVRFTLIVVGVLFAGVLLGGGEHLIASIISGIGRLAFDFPLFFAGVGVGVAAGFWLGGDRALHKLGEFEKDQRWDRIRK